MDEDSNFDEVMVMRGVRKLVLMMVLAGGMMAAHQAGAENPQDRRNKSVATSIYNTGKHGAAKWGERSALSLCKAPLDDNEAQADARDEAATIDDFKDWMRDAYGTHYDRYSGMIDPLLNLPEHYHRFNNAQNAAAERLISNDCAPAIVEQLEQETDKAIDGLRASMERMAKTLSVR